VKLVVDQERCRGHAQCVAVAPELFELRGGRSHVLVEEPGPQHASAVEDAILMCPEAAISRSDG
jgi:ferredoxin